ncbi:MAG: acyl carrier protein [Gammaproteobacteria bacterium]
MTLDYDDTLERIRKTLAQVAGTEVSIDADTNLVEQFALDSVKVLDLIMEIEDEFDISIPLNLMADVQYVRDLVAVIQRIQSEQ